MKIDLSALARHRSLTEMLMCLSRCKDNEAFGRIAYFSWMKVAADPEDDRAAGRDAHSDASDADCARAVCP